ncbi:MAG: Ribosomal protein [Verrucomicrobiota bacterium]|jgi:large subunit ribosomal protein L34
MMVDSNFVVDKVRGSAAVADLFTMKRQYQPKKIRRVRQHGFLARMATRGGRANIANRRRQGRRRLTPV